VNWTTRGDRAWTLVRVAVRTDLVDTRRERGMVVAASRAGIRNCRDVAAVEGGTGLRGAWVCTEAAVAAVGAVAWSRLPVAPAEAASVAVGRSRRCRVEEDRHRAGMEAWPGVAEQAAVVVLVGCFAAARVWAGLAQAQKQAAARLSGNSLALTFVVVLVGDAVVGRVCWLVGCRVIYCK
jgi:hypothetical protein